MSAPHSTHPQDEVGVFNPDCEDCTDAIVFHFMKVWGAKPKPGYSRPEDLMRKMSGWEWANTFAQIPDKDNFQVQIEWFSRALTAGYDAGYSARGNEIRKRLGL